MYKNKIYFIIGPTSSGKTAHSIELAKTINAEIISADSRQVFRDLNISTGKITKTEMENIPHHLLDVINPGEYFSVIDYTNLVLQKIEEVYERGNVPIICGGTGFYIDSLLYKYNLPKVEKNETLRLELNQKTISELWEILKVEDYNFGKKIEKNLEYRNNRHRVMRTIEVIKALGHFPELKKIERFDKENYDIEIINIKVERNILREKIHTRLLQRIEDGMIEEINSVKEKYNLDYIYLEGLGLEFKWVARYLKGEVTKNEMKEKLFFEICQYAKRQDTWFKRYG